ncbi:hypothetical protein KDL45_08595, partial [bacterium]|nr:hypothetical protein [bacterium]
AILGAALILVAVLVRLIPATTRVGAPFEQEILLNSGFGATYLNQLFGDYALRYEVYGGGPLYEFLVNVWTLISVNTLWVRLLSVIFSVATLVTAFLFIQRKVTGPTAALMFAFLAFHPLTVDVGSTINSVSVAAFFVMLSVYHSVEWLGRNGEKAKAKTTLATLAAVYTHPAAWPLIVFYMLVAVTTRLHPGFRPRDAIKPVVGMVLGSVPMWPAIVRRIVTRGEIPDSGWSALQTLALSQPFGGSLDNAIGGSGPLAVLASSGDEGIGALIVLAGLPAIVLTLIGAVRHAFVAWLFFLPLALLAFVDRSFGQFDPKLIVMFVPAALGCLSAGVGELNKRRGAWMWVGRAAGAYTLGVFGLVTLYLIINTAP